MAAKENTFELTITSPERVLVRAKPANSVLIEGAEGQIEILPGHSQFITNLEAGIFTVKLHGESPKVGVISSGFIEVDEGRVTVAADTLELIDEIDIDRAKRAAETARAALEKQDATTDSFRKHQLKLQRALIRQQAANR